jgi:hypothetical protein
VYSVNGSSLTAVVSGIRSALAGHVSSRAQDDARVRSALDTRVVPIAGLLMLLAACSSDGVVAPKRSVLPPGAPRPEIIMNLVADDSMSADFTVTPEGGTFILGQHAVIFPANAICDPATSSYGIGTWDETCTPVDTAITFHAEIRTDSASSRIALTPSVRFVPTDDPNQYAWIMLHNNSAENTADPSAYPIMWISDDGTAIDESLTDPSLATYLYIPGGIAFRRIKHFSAYNCWGQNEELSDVIPIE